MCEKCSNTGLINYGEYLEKGVDKQFCDCKDGELRRQLRRGTQVAYVPNHANDLHHPDVEYGFVTSVGRWGAFCRFWNKKGDDIRTKANSELAYFANLVVYESHSEAAVQSMLEAWC